MVKKPPRLQLPWTGDLLPEGRLRPVRLMLFEIWPCHQIPLAQLAMPGPLL
jgi:hypothetical protein